MLLSQERTLVSSAQCLVAPSCQVANAWKLMIAARHMCRRFLSLKNHQHSYLNRFHWVRTKILRMTCQRICLSYPAMSRSNLVWMNSKLKLRRWSSHYLVALLIYHPFLWSQIIPQRLSHVSSKLWVSLRNKRKVHKFNSSRKLLSSKCLRLSLSVILRRFFRERSSTWRRLLMNRRETTAIWALKRREMILNIIIWPWEVLWVKSCLARDLTRVRQISKLLILVRR